MAILKREIFIRGETRMTTENKINELIDLINYHNEKYYNHDTPEISDYEYDNLMKELTKLEEEKELLKLFEEIDRSNHTNIEDYYFALRKLTKPINNFFEKVLVNDPDPKIKQARQALLKKGKDLFEKICDFNQILERN